MKLQDIAQKKFSRKLLGYNTAQVRTYLSEVEQQLEALKGYLETALKERDSLEAELKAFREREKGLESALARTNEMAEEIRSNARKESELLVAEAELQAEKILGQAHNRLARIHEDISELKRQRAQFEVRLRALVEAHLKLLEAEGERDREMVELEDKIKILRTPSS